MGESTNEYDINELKKQSIYLLNENDLNSDDNKKLDFEFGLINCEIFFNKCTKQQTSNNKLQTKALDWEKIEKLPGRIILFCNEEDCSQNELYLTSLTEYPALKRTIHTRFACSYSKQWKKLKNLLKKDEDDRYEKFKKELYEIWVNNLTKIKFSEDKKIQDIVAFKWAKKDSSNTDSDLERRRIKNLINTNKEILVWMIYEYNKIYNVNKNVDLKEISNKLLEYQPDEEFSEFIKRELGVGCNGNIFEYEAIFNYDIDEKIPCIYLEGYSNEKNETEKEEKEIKTGNEKREYEIKKDTTEIVYKRHETVSFNKSGDYSKFPALIDGNDYYYGEALSGSTISSMIMRAGMKRKKGYFINSLCENGLFRILIADERIVRYAGRDRDYFDSLRCAGIDVIKDLNGMEVRKSYEDQEIRDFTFEEVEGLTYKETSNNKYDAFIIHQGLLDKIQINEEKLNEEEINESIELWRNKFPFIYITTGRGKTKEIAKNAKYIPFSVLESTLMKKPHEKFLLTKIMLKA